VTIPCAAAGDAAREIGIVKHGRSVLVVEDEGHLARMMAEALAESGYRVCGTAPSAREALKLAEAQDPAFAVVDIDLAARGEALRLGRDLTRRGIAVLYATRNAPAWRQEMEDSGGRALLEKPFPATDVPQALDALESLSACRVPPPLPAGFHLFVD
jgi:ActR/RegA family two-component response regulator